MIRIKLDLMLYEESPQLFRKGQTMMMLLLSFDIGHNILNRGTTYRKWLKTHSATRNHVNSETLRESNATNCFSPS